MDKDWEVLEGKPGDWVESFYKNGTVPCARVEYLIRMTDEKTGGEIRVNPSEIRTHEIRVVSYKITFLYEQITNSVHSRS